MLGGEGFLSLVLPVLAEQSHAVAELGLENNICNICSHKTMAKDTTEQIQRMDSGSFSP